MAPRRVPLVLAEEEPSQRWTTKDRAEVRKLIRDLWNGNPTRGKPRIQAELAKLGITVSDSTVAKYKPKRRKPPSQNWRTFLDNHAKDIVATDFFVVPTATFLVLYVLLVMSHDRRRILHFVNPSPLTPFRR